MVFSFRPRTFFLIKPWLITSRITNSFNLQKKISKNSSREYLIMRENMRKKRRWSEFSLKTSNDREKNDAFVILKRRRNQSIPRRGFRALSCRSRVKLTRTRRNNLRWAILRNFICSTFTSKAESFLEQTIYNARIYVSKLENCDGAVYCKFYAISCSLLNILFL